MYRSLEKYSSDFHLYIFAFDDKCYEVLNALNLPYASVISLQEFEDEELLEVKKTRTAKEYCWTCTPSTIVFCLNNFNIDHCIYIDADLLFFSDPLVLISELGDKSIMITEHRYSPEYNQTATSGKYCVQFVLFKNDAKGWHVLNWWRNACMEWCYSRFEDGKFGDQKYLDNWMTMFDSVHELQHLGGGIAPWNVQQYRFKKKRKKLLGKELSTGREFEAIFYHFHDFTCSVNSIYCISHWYRLSEDVIHTIYGAYIKALTNAEKELFKVAGWKSARVEVELSWVWKSIRRTFLIFFRGRYKNYYHRSYFYRLLWPI